MAEAYPDAEQLLEACRIIGTTTIDKIRKAGFDVLPNPTRRFPNHYRIVHPNGELGFNDENLAKLAETFTDSEGLRND
jgi:hypothetical protein